MEFGGAVKSEFGRVILREGEGGDADDLLRARQIIGIVSCTSRARGKKERDRRVEGKRKGGIEKID